MEIGEIVLFPRILDNSEMERLEGYLGHRWTLNEFFPSSHPYRATKPTGETGLVLNGKPERAGEFAVTAKVTNFLGTTQQSFNLTVQAIPPRIRTAGPRDVGSTSARLTANLVETGGKIPTSPSYGAPTHLRFPMKQAPCPYRLLVKPPASYPD